MKIRVEKIVKHQAPCTLSFQVQDQDQAQVYNFWRYFPLSVQENLIFVSIDMVTVVLDVECIRLKYMLQIINYNQVDPVIEWAQTVATIKFTFSFIKYSLEFREVLFGEQS